MTGFSYSEIQNMQKRAMERVREMQRNSEAVVDSAQKEFSENTVAQRTEKSHNDGFIKPKITNMPPNFPEEKAFPDFKEYFQGEKEKTSQPSPKAEKSHIQSSTTNPLENILSEPDRALLLGLLLLLKSEGADEALMMALMYIMA